MGLLSMKILKYPKIKEKVWYSDPAVMGLDVPSKFQVAAI